jgi:hypothetical protein
MMHGQQNIKFGGRAEFSREKTSKWYKWRRSRWLDKECAKLSVRRKEGRKLSCIGCAVPVKLIDVI